MNSSLTRRQWITLSAMTAFGALISGGKLAEAKPNATVYEHCAQACHQCQKSCMACHKHCQAMVKAGILEHRATVRLSEDCQDLCAVAAKLCERKGPMTVAACEACLKSCQACSVACRKYKGMPVMVACAQACDVCAAACRAMIVS